MSEQSPEVNAPHIIVIGPPGGGKGTLCDTLAQRYVHLSTGDLLRAEISKGTELGKQVESKMRQGSLVPDDVVTSLIHQRVSQPDCQSRGFILDGIPRTPNQVKGLQLSVDIVIVLHVPAECLVSRLTNRRLDPVTGKIYNLKTNMPSEKKIQERLRQRPDDFPETIRRRLASYERNLREIIHELRRGTSRFGGPDLTLDHTPYRCAPHFIHLDGTHAPDVVANHCQQQLEYFSSIMAFSPSQIGNQKEPINSKL